MNSLGRSEVPTIGVANGGTGLTSLAQGDLLIVSAADEVVALAKNASATRYLSNTGASNAPAWSQVNLANGVTGTLPIGSGGTNLTTYTTGDLPYASASNVLSKLAIGAAGAVLSVQLGVPGWTVSPSLTNLTLSGTISVGTTGTYTGLQTYNGGIAFGNGGAFTGGGNRIVVDANWGVSVIGTGGNAGFTIFDTNVATLARFGVLQIGFFGSIASQAVDGVALTNSVTVGGTNNTIADFTDLTIFANSAAAIRNNLYQLARKLKLVSDAMRAYGLQT